MKLLRITTAAALAATSFSSFAISLGALDLSTGSTGFFNTPIVGLFSDTATFTLSTPSTVIGSVTSVVSGNQDVDFTSIGISGPSGSFNFALANPDPFELWTTTSPGFVLGVGNSTLTLAGTNSVGAGSYAGNLAVTAVPEPGTVALMLAGLSVAAFVARRRDKA